MNTYITSENIEEIKRRLDFLANNYDVKYKDVKIGVLKFYLQRKKIT